MSHGPRIGRSQSPCCSLAGYGVVAFCSTRFGTFSTAPTHTMHKPHRADRHRRTLLRRSTAVGCCPIASPSLPSLSAHLSPPSSKSLFFLSLSLSSLSIAPHSFFLFSWDHPSTFFTNFTFDCFKCPDSSLGLPSLLNLVLYALNSTSPFLFFSDQPPTTFLVCSPRITPFAPFMR